jgi:hypothetical protein
MDIIITPPTTALRPRSESPFVASTAIAPSWHLGARCTNGLAASVSGTALTGLAGTGRGVVRNAVVGNAALRSDVQRTAVVATAGMTAKQAAVPRGVPR